MNKIEKFIEEKGLTRAQFCARIGIDKGTLSRYISGQRKPTTNIMIKICNEFNLSLQEFTEVFINEN